MARFWISVLAFVVALGFTIEGVVAAEGYRAAPGAVARVDPYKNFKFRVRIEGRVVAGFAKVSGLVLPSRSGPPFQAIILQQGVTHDGAFEHWASAAARRQARARWQADKKDVVIEARNERGQVAKTYVVAGAWVSKYVGAPDLDASANDVAIAVIELQHEGLTLE